MARATHAIIDLQALRQNYQKARQLAPHSKARAVVKANAYGHGMLRVAQALSHEADGLAVACVDEAVQLREAGLLLPILVLQGAYSAEETRTAQALDLELAVHHAQQIEWLEKIEASPALHVWVKVDSGMHRLGFAVEDVPAAVSRLRKLPQVDQLSLMSHFACADDPADKHNALQLRMMSTLKPFGLPVSMANSAAVMTLPESHGQVIRPGIMLYGATPLMHKDGPDLGLLPVMTLQSEIIALHKVNAGDTVGYGGSWSAQRNSVIATVAIGYGDGYPRHAGSGTPVLIRGKKCPLAGRVSMDMITVDVTDLVDVQLADKVTLWGTGLSADTIARHAGTIAYELFCQVTSRVRFKYLGA
jgi:alanine racemase